MQSNLGQSLTKHQGVNTLGNNGFDIRPLKINNSEMNYLNKKEIMWKGRFPSGIDECGASQYCCKAQLSSYSKATHTGSFRKNDKSKMFVKI